MQRIKRLWVDSYCRIVDGVLQHVRGHFRRYPQRKSSATITVLHTSLT